MRTISARSRRCSRKHDRGVRRRPRRRRRCRPRPRRARTNPRFSRVTITHTFTPERDKRAEPLAAWALIAAAVAAVVVYAPPEGRVLAPLHEAVATLLGQASFVLPVGLAFVGVLLAIRRVRPSVALPTRRLTGLALLAIAVLPAERLLGYSTGLI